jgi:serine/threonine protein kinase
LINQYEIINELGRGNEGKVKRARNLDNNGEEVAIKIVPRYSKKRRLGKVTVSPEDKTRREIAILKKIRHPNVVGLYEIIDDPENKKIYLVLEYVELGEIVWRKKGVPSICAYERHRLEREARGEPDSLEDALWFKAQHERHLRNEAAREKLNRHHLAGNYWSLEHGVDDEDDATSLALSRQATHESMGHFAPRSYASQTSIGRSNPASRVHSRATSRAPSRASSTAARTPMPLDIDCGPLDSDNEDEEIGPLPSIPSTHSSAAALDAHVAAYFGGDSHSHFRGRSPSMAESVISHMSSVDVSFNRSLEDEFTYVPSFSIDQARSIFRDTVLGLEYLHYHGIVHRDIKPSNLLYTRDYRVKISDFGVSYFGRPTRDGEADEAVSESDARDFDDDLELAKTVGTPAFFAPELCYTDINKEQPKITEQLDVWSLGVTLYCLIYGRIPFRSPSDEYELFRVIAEQEPYISTRRLKPISPEIGLTPGAQIPAPPAPPGTYRDEQDFELEEVDDELIDLLRRLLVKDPAERIKLREVKRHPWVIRGIDNIIGWLDDTDPSRKTAGRRIQVDDKELERAVIPISIFERARSAMKKTVGKVFGRGEGSRKRAVSSATSSGTDISQSTPATPARDRDSRRSSIRVDDSYFTAVRDPRSYRDPAEHPLAQSVTASPDLPASEGDAFANQSAAEDASMLGTPRGIRSDTDSGSTVRPSLAERSSSTAASIQTVIRRLSHSRSFSDAATSPVTSPLHPVLESPLTFTDHNGEIIRDGGRLFQEYRGTEVRAQSSDSHMRPRSVERPLFTATDKHAEAIVAVSNAVAPGNIESSTPRRRTSTRSRPASPDLHQILHSPHPFRPSGLATHQQTASASNVPLMLEKMYAASIIDDRPSTANRTPEGRTPAPRVYPQSTPESFARAQEQLERRRRLEEELEGKKLKKLETREHQSHPGTPSTCPPSPDDETFRLKQEESRRIKSYGSVNSAPTASSFASPSEVNSPVQTTSHSFGNLDSLPLTSSSEQNFRSDPSLPTLVSGASSVSADNEGDFLSQPGVVKEGTHSSPGTLTPPRLSKEPSHESGHGLNTAIPAVADEDDGYTADGDLAAKTEDEDDDSDSDEGLTMSRGKKKPPPRRQNTLTRYNTNASVGSTETAKQVPMVD